MRSELATMKTIINTSRLTWQLIWNKTLWSSASFETLRGVVFWKRTPGSCLGELKVPVQVLCERLYLREVSAWKHFAKLYHLVSNVLCHVSWEVLIMAITVAKSVRIQLLTVPQPSKLNRKTHISISSFCDFSIISGLSGLHRCHKHIRSFVHSYSEFMS